MGEREGMKERKEMRKRGRTEKEREVSDPEDDPSHRCRRDMSTPPWWGTTDVHTVTPLGVGGESVKHLKRVEKRK